jgi:hypothetical protein
MSLADRFQNPPTRKPKCSVGILLTTLEGDELAALEGMVGVWPDSKVYAALLAEGHSVGLQQIGRHHRQQCSCLKAAA